VQHERLAQISEPLTVERQVEAWERSAVVVAAAALEEGG
jgi:hypothetical protein